MGEEKVEGLNVRDLLKDTYSELSRRHNPREIVLPQKALAEIANDSDWHRTREGYMGYESAGLFDFGKKTWAIARGEACGSYPADPYDSDLLAVDIEVEGKDDETIAKELTEGIGRSPYFRSSLVFGLRDGNISLNKDGRFGGEMLKILRPEIDRFIAQRAEYDTSFIMMSTLQHPTKKCVLYTPDFAGFLADSIEEILAEGHR